MSHSCFQPARLLFGATTLALAAGAGAAQVQVTVTAQNLAADNSISFAPLHVGFHNGSFDPFDLGGTPGAGIVSVAEGGGGQQWQADFAAADPSATRGTVGGLRTPGSSASLSFVVDTALNPFFSFGAMAVPSNDFFIGNDDARAYRLFNAAGQQQISEINLQARDIWDAGSEVFNPLAAAFVGNNDLRADQKSVVALNFAELAAFNGFTTGAGYVFQSGLAADTPVYRISFAVSAVPEPQTHALLASGLLAVGWVARRRRPAAVAGFTAA